MKSPSGSRSSWAGRDVRAGVESRMVNQTDFAPTFLDLAGLEHGDLDGYSLVPLLGADAGVEDGRIDWRSDQLLEYNGTWGGHLGLYDTFEDVRRALDRGERRMPVPSYRAIRTETKLYVRWYRGEEHEYELYDLEEDPHQLENLLGNEAGLYEYAAEAATLEARLRELEVCAGAGCR